MRLFSAYAALAEAFRSAAVQGFDRIACAKNSIPNSLCYFEWKKQCLHAGRVSVTAEKRTFPLLLANPFGSTEPTQAFSGSFGEAGASWGCAPPGFAK